jgi:hypothetical protein
LVKSTELLAKDASGRAIASRANKTIRFIPVFLLNLVKLNLVEPSMVRRRF